VPDGSGESRQNLCADTRSRARDLLVNFEIEDFQLVNESWRANEDVKTSMDRLKTDNTNGDTQKKTAVPATKRKDGTYIPAVVPPEWEAYHPAKSSF